MIMSSATATLLSPNVLIMILYHLFPICPAALLQYSNHCRDLPALPECSTAYWALTAKPSPPNYTPYMISTSYKTWPAICICCTDKFHISANLVHLSLLNSKKKTLRWKWIQQKIKFVCMYVRKQLTINVTKMSKYMPHNILAYILRNNSYDDRGIEEYLSSLMHHFRF
jgi:hypothetical protein